MAKSGLVGKGVVELEQFQKWPVLSEVNSPKDLKALDRKGLATLAREIREYLVYRVGENGGHLASNLGVVELTMAIHRVFDVPRDHLIFDVGHQSYVHKLLTERKDRFDTLRQAGGISGFTRREESAYDAFGAGHSSTAISAAIGMAEADRLAGRDCYTIAVVGDGALTGGLAYEGMNNCRRDLKLIIIINENEMSISPNTGRFAEYLSHVRTSPSYIRTKAFTKSALRHIPLFGKPLHRLAGAVKRTIKRRFYRRNMFEYMGAHFLGPMDGNDLDGMIACLSYAQKLSGSIILHVKTQKGRGYAPAEKDPNRYHGLPPKEPPPAAPTKLSEEMGRALCDLASRDGRICAITAAMSDGTGLTPFREAYPQRFYDVGIAEGHAVTFAAGLAAGGMRPFVALYSTFLQRAYDNILHDAALQGLPVTLCIDRAGLNPFDGVTHHGIYDVAMLSSLSGVSIYAPVTARGIRASLRAAQESGGVSAIRYSARGEDPAVMAAFYGDSESDDTPRVRVWQSGRGCCGAHGDHPRKGGGNGTANGHTTAI